MSAMEDRNYWMDRRVRMRDPNHAAWRLDEGRHIAFVPRGIVRGCEACEAEGEPCDEHGAEEGEEERDARGEEEQRIGRLIAAPNEVAIPFTWGTCGTCDGDGKHVNPSIDAGGISGDDFDADPDFAESYMRGAYDVTCGECRGRRVVPVLAPKTEEEIDALKAIEASEEEDAAYERTCRMERAMGA